MFPTTTTAVLLNPPQVRIGGRPSPFIDGRSRRIPTQIFLFYLFVECLGHPCLHVPQGYPPWSSPCSQNVAFCRGVCRGQRAPGRAAQPLFYHSHLLIITWPYITAHSRPAPPAQNPGARHLLTAGAHRSSAKSLSSHDGSTDAHRRELLNHCSDVIPFLSGPSRSSSSPNGSRDATARLSTGRNPTLACGHLHPPRTSRQVSSALNAAIAARHRRHPALRRHPPSRRAGRAGGSLLSNFADPTVGCVAGELLLLTQDRHDATASAVSGLYWRYEQWIRNCEAAVDSPVGVYGGFYAIRRFRWRSLPRRRG